MTKQEAKELQKVHTAMTTLRSRFIEIDPMWNNCGEKDYMGMYRFLTGPRSYTMSHVFGEFTKEIAIIKAYGEKKIAEYMKNSVAA
jgi:hypothetical protein